MVRQRNNRFGKERIGKHALKVVEVRGKLYNWGMTINKVKNHKKGLAQIHIKQYFFEPKERGFNRIRVGLKRVFFASRWNTVILF